MNRRNKIDIVFDLLKAVSDKGGKIKPTHLLYKSNLSHTRMKVYLEELMGKQLIEETKEKGKTMYALTDEGYKFISNYKQLKNFTEAFGLWF